MAIQWNPSHIALALLAAAVVVACLPTAHAAKGSDSGTGGYGYVWSNIPINYNEVRGSTSLITADDTAAPYTFGISGFKYYGTSYTSGSVSENGWVLLGGGATGAAAKQYTPRQLPSAGPPATIVAPWWTDQQSATACVTSANSPPAGTTQKVWGSALPASLPFRNQVQVTEWDALSLVGNAGECGGFSTYEAEFYEGTDILEYHLKTTHDYDTTSTPAGTTSTCQDASMGMMDSGPNGLNLLWSTGCPASGDAGKTNTAYRIWKNDPNGADQTVAVAATTPKTFTLDSSDDPIAYSIVTAPVGGTLTNFPTAGQTYYLPPPDVTYTANAGFCGKDTLKFKADDLYDTANTFTVTFNVTCPFSNKAPSFMLPASPNQVVADSAGLQTLTAFANSIDPGSGESTQKLVFQVTVDNAAMFATQPAITPTTLTAGPWTTMGTLTYALNDGLCAAGGGTATVTVRLKDDGGTANGGVDTSVPHLFTIQTDCPGQAPPPPPGGTSTSDSDGDGYSDYYEEQTGSDPYNGASTPIDHDADGIPDSKDNCPVTFNPQQEDSNSDGRGNACQNYGTAGPDSDGDGYPDSPTVDGNGDNCPYVPNVGQSDIDQDGIGDACDNDIDGDGASNDQERAAHSDPLNPLSKPGDRDGDGVADRIDNCVPDADVTSPAGLHATYNPDQADANHDGVGDPCDKKVALGLEANATYDGRVLKVNWYVVSDASVRSTAQALDHGHVLLVAKPSQYGAGHHTAELVLPNLQSVTWQVVLDDPFDPSVHKWVNGTALPPANVPVWKPAILEQPASAGERTSVHVAYVLPAATTDATLQLQTADGRAAASIPLVAGANGTWAATAKVPAAGTYHAIVVYTQGGARTLFDTGQMVLKAQAPATPTGSVTASGSSTHPLGWLWWTLGVLAGLAAAGLVALAIVTVQRRRARPPTPPQGDAPASEPEGDYDTPIDV